MMNIIFQIKPTLMKSIFKINRPLIQTIKVFIVLILISVSAVHALPIDSLKGLVKQKKKIVFIAGPRSHGKGEHEFKGGCTLLAKQLNEHTKNINAVVYDSDWPTDNSVLEDADAIVIFSDGGEGHMIIPHLEEMDKLMKKGVGLVLLHYAVELPKGEKGNYFLNWVGGYYEPFWSVNPTFNGKFETIPTHEITRGVRPFEAYDEWYYHMRFTKDMKNVTPLLVTLPPKIGSDKPDGSHDNNPFVREESNKGIPQIMAWAFKRSNGGRGFGFTGGHVHNNWMNDDFRKLVLNAILWTAKVKVPKDGLHTPTPTQSELDSLLDKSK